MRPLIPATMLAFLGACASLTPEQCIDGNWQNIGYNDGVRGRLESYISRHFDACADVGITPDVQEWMAGRTQGLPLYCTPQNAYDIGRNGNSFNPVCPASQRYELDRAWDWGQEYHEVSEEIDDLEDEIDDINRRIYIEFSTPPLTLEQQTILSHLNREISRNRSKIFRLRSRLRRYDSPPY